MTLRTRRGLLTVLTGLAGGLAGCAGQSATSSRSVSETNRRTISDDNAATDPPMLQRRSTATQPAIRLQEAGSQEAEQTETDEESHHRLGYDTNEIIDTAATAARLVTNADSTDADSDDTGDGDTDAADSELSAFIAATDFETETLYLETNRVEQCYRLSLCYVSWQDNGIHTSYGRRLSPYDEACTADRKVTETRLIRLPVALSADSISSVGTSIGSARCERVVETRVNESTDRNGTASGSMVSSGGST